MKLDLLMKLNQRVDRHYLCLQSYSKLCAAPEFAYIGIEGFADWSSFIERSNPIIVGIPNGKILKSHQMMSLMVS